MKTKTYLTQEDDLKTMQPAALKKRIFIRNKFECNPVNSKLPIERTQTTGHHGIQTIIALNYVKEGNSHVPFFQNDDLQTTLDTY